MSEVIVSCAEKGGGKSEYPALVLTEAVIDPAYGMDESLRAQTSLWAEAIERDGHDAVINFFRRGTGARTPANVQRRIIDDLLATEPAAIARYLRSEYLDVDAIGMAGPTSELAARRRAPLLELYSTPRTLVVGHEVADNANLLESWDGHSHYLHLEDPERFCSLLANWMDYLEARSEAASASDEFAVEAASPRG